MSVTTGERTALRRANPGHMAFAASISLALCLLAGTAGEAQQRSTGIRVDSETARRTVEAAVNPDLTRAQALAIADLPGNIGLVQQAIGFKVMETRESFADALVDAAHGRDTHTIFQFQEVRATAAASRRALDLVASDPKALTDWIAQRMAPFVPTDVPLSGTGYIVVGGPGGGFSIDGGVYINLARDKGEMDVVRVDLSHEFYHGVQHAAQIRAGTRKDFEFDETAFRKLPDEAARRCYATRELFGKLMMEGTASYVGDVALYPMTGDEALSRRTQRAASLSGDAGNAASLLEIGLAAITADDPVPEQSAYAMGFLYAGQLYYDLGYVMAKAIAHHDGDAAIGRLIAMPGDAFVRRYIEISEAPDARLPKLGARAKKWAARQGC